MKTYLSLLIIGLFSSCNMDFEPRQPTVEEVRTELTNVVKQVEGPGYSIYKQEF